MENLSLIKIVVVVNETKTYIISLFCHILRHFVSLSRCHTVLYTYTFEYFNKKKEQIKHVVPKYSYIGCFLSLFATDQKIKFIEIIQFSFNFVMLHDPLKVWLN